MKLGDLTVGIIVENEEFLKQMNALADALRKIESEITTTAGQENLKMQRMQEQVVTQQLKSEKAKIQVSREQLKLQDDITRQKSKVTGEDERNSRLALQQQYYQVSSLRRLSFMVAGITAVVSVFGKKAVESFMNFEQKMADARAAAQATEGQFAKMTELALRLGRSTIFSAQEAAEGMELLAKAGYQASDVMKALDGSMLLAGATGENLAGGVALLVAVLHQFEIATDKSSEVANTLAGGAQFSLATVQNLGQGLKFVGSTAHQFSISLEETVTALAALSNAGIRMQMSGRLLSSGLQTLNSNSGAVNKGLTELGIKFDEVAPATHTLTQILDRFKKAQIEVGDAQKYSSAMTTLFGKESSRVIIPLVQMGDAFGELLKRIEDPSNATAMMIMRTDTLQYALKELSNVFQNIMISIGRASGEGGLKTFVRGMTELLRSIEGGNQGLLKLIGNLIPYITAVLMATTATIGLAAGVATLSLAINELHAASAAASLGWLASAVTLPNVVIGLIALTGIVIVATSLIQKMGDTWENTAKKFKKIKLEFEIKKFQTESLVENWNNARKELEKLTPETEAYKQEKIQLLDIESQLLAIYPELNLRIGEQTVSYEVLTEQLRQLNKESKRKLDLDYEIAMTKQVKELEDQLKKLDQMSQKYPTKILLRVKPSIDFNIEDQKAKIRAQIEDLRVEWKKYTDEIEGKSKEKPEVIGPKEPFEWTKTGLELYQDFTSEINKLTMNRYELERTKIRETVQDWQNKIDKEIDADKEATDIQKEEMKKRLKVLKPLYVELADTKLEEERVEKVRELLQKEGWEAEKAGLEGLALRRAQANQEFEQDKADWDKRIKEGEISWAEYAQAIMLIRMKLKAETGKIDQDEGEIYKKVQAEILGLEAQAKIQRATGRERELLEIGESRRKDLADLEEKKAKEPELTELYRREEELINQKYDAQRQEALMKLQPLQEMVLTKVIDSMVDLVAITKDWGEYFKNTIQQLMMDLVKLAVKIALVQMAASLLNKPVGILGGLFGLPAGIFGAGGLFGKVATPGMSTPAMAGMPVLPKLAPTPPQMNFGYPVVNNRTSREIKVFSTINVQGDVLDMDQFYRKKIRPAQQRFLGRRFE